MKTLLLILLFAFAGVEIMYGQQVASVASLNAEKCTTDTEIDFLRECLSKYHAQRKRAYYAAGSSVALSAIGASMNQSGQRVFFILGGVAGLYSTVLFLDAEKHLKQASVKPMTGAAGVTLTLRL